MGERIPPKHENLPELPCSPALARGTGEPPRGHVVRDADGVSSSQESEALSNDPEALGLLHL